MTGITARLKNLQPSAIGVGKPSVAQGAAIHRLVDACKPLDLNSLYAYLLLCEHHAETCVIAEREGRPVGFLSAYVIPLREDTIFVWQVAVDASARGLGLATTMLRELLARPQVRHCAYLETTVSPSNTASRRLFHALARELDAPVDETLLFAEDHFGGEDHECEMSIRVGPFQGK
jgi:L-2,4-diaminobutyric acid acetyltransferase